MSLNGQAAARLYDEHVDAVYGYAARRVGPDVAVEVVKEVFEHALRQNAERPARTGTDLGWMLALTTAFLRRHGEAECDRLRNWTPQLRDSARLVPRVTDPLLDEAGNDVGAATTARVMAALAELEPVERDLMFLVAWERCSSSTAAAATGIPAGSVRSRLAAIRKEIRTRVDAMAAEANAAAHLAASESAAAPDVSTLPPDTGEDDHDSPPPDAPGTLDSPGTPYSPRTPYSPGTPGDRDDLDSPEPAIPRWSDGPAAAGDDGRGGTS